MENKSKSQLEMRRLLNQYIACLNIYFEALHEALLRAKQQPNPLRLSKDATSVDVLERFIAVGKKLETLLREAQQY